MFIFWFTLAVIWISCGVAACGYQFAYMQRRFHEIREECFYAYRWICLVYFFLGLPVLLLTLLDNYDRYGWLWPWSIKAKQEAFFNITFEE